VTQYTSLTERRFFTPAALLAIAGVVSIFTLFVDIEHANPVAQAVYLTLAGYLGLAAGISFERHYDSPDDMTPHGFAICMVLMLSAINWVAFLGVNFQFASQYVHTSFWMTTQAAIIIFCAMIIGGSQAAFRYPVKSKPAAVTPELATTCQGSIRTRRLPHCR
jgi:hypothetical protein